MFSFSKVVEVLRAVDGVPATHAKAFHARIQHYQRLGIVPSSPGKGKRISYTLDDLYRWAFCVELANFGIDPVLIAGTIEQYWSEIKLGFYAGGDEIWRVYFAPAFATAGDDSKFHFFVHFAETLDKGLESARLLTGTLSDRVKNRFHARHGSINLTRIVRGVDKALMDLDEAEGA